MNKDMMRLCGGLLMALLAFAACKKAEELTYDHNASVYFDLDVEHTNKNDSIVRNSFAYDPTMATDTVYIPVRISGVVENVDRSYVAYIERDSSTAEEGLHYEALADHYVMPANKGLVYLPFYIFNTPDLQEKTVSVIIKLQASDDFGIGNPRLIRVKVNFSARLEEPVWWAMWEGDYYSRTKHQLFLVVTGQTDLTQDGLDAPKNLYFVNMLVTMMNDPFVWVAKNPDKGYVLEPVEEGSDASYYFFNTENPERTILLRKNAAAGKYYFIDENGEEIH